ATGFSGTLNHVKVAVPQQIINYTGLSPMNDTVSEPLFEIDGTAAGEQINVVNGPLVGGVQTTQVNSGASATFETINFGNKTTARVNSNGGNDPVTVTPPTAPPGLSPLVVPSQGVLNVQATPAATTTNFVGGGVTTVTVGSAGSVQGILGPLNIENPPSF